MGKLKKIPFVKFCVVCARQLLSKQNILKRIYCLFSYLKDYKKYIKTLDNPNFNLSSINAYPMIFDKTSTQQVDYVYFYQDSWCAGKIFQAKPKHHYDIASKAEMVGIISQFIPTTMVDIRSLGVFLPNLTFKEGNLGNLPFKDGTIESLSSICVIEHIGLGRYGDPLEPWGSENSAGELKRVLKEGGDLYISVPIDTENTIYFNAHRAFTRDYVLSVFSPLKLIEEKYIYNRDGIVDTYDKNRGFGTGLFHFKK